MIIIVEMNDLIYGNIPRKGVLMGIDYGEVRTGIAFSDIDQMFSVPNGVYGPKNKIVELLKNLIVERDVVGIVVGWPLNMKGDKGFQCEETEIFIKSLYEDWNGPIDIFDERLSSAYVASMYNMGPKHDTDDALAAMVILDSFMKSRRNNDK